MTTNWRALCAELTEALLDEAPGELVLRACAALAEPEPEGPTVMEIIELADEIEAAELGQVDLVRAALARWGHQPAPPAEGEVAELVAWLRGANWDRKRQTLATRAADLLEQRHPASVPAEGEVE